MERLTVDRSTKWLLGLNLGGFVLVHLLGYIGLGIEWLGFKLPSPWPWTPLTYMFSQGAIIELLFNMLFLWCFCRLFMLVGTPKQLITSYVAGGLGGALIFALAWAAGFTPGGPLLGASAAVIGIAVCASFIAPNYGVNLLLLGRVTLRAVAIITVAFSLLPFLEHNPGGGWAHIGGVFAGTACGLAMKHGFMPRYSHRSIKKTDELMTLDSLLDKIKRSGYGSLNAAERRRLIELSKEL
ncbi:MAG: rhomboid family intramembrane serine protease [Muribaculaceae bacterium]|nr:rhomboid family intramembrane serine protease [Muribaculaceae bacterium]